MLLVSQSGNAFSCLPIKLNSIFNSNVFFLRFAFATTTTHSRIHLFLYRQYIQRIKQTPSTATHRRERKAQHPMYSRAFPELCLCFSLGNKQKHRALSHPRARTKMNSCMRIWGKFLRKTGTDTSVPMGYLAVSDGVGGVDGAFTEGPCSIRWKGT